MKLSATPVQVRRPPPLLGQHTDEVLAEIGIDAAARQHLRDIGAIGGTARRRRSQPAPPGVK